MSTTPETNPQPNTDARARDVDHIVSDLAELGTAWARYGLSIGRMALETGARTLSTTARLLGDLADTLPRGAQAEPAKQDEQVVIDVKPEKPADAPNPPA